jgi:hypothetical protein
VHHHARRLVEDEEVVVLVQDRERQVLGDEAGGLGGRELELDALAALEPPRRLRGATLDLDAPVRHEALDAGAGEIRREPRQRDVEAGAGELGGGDEGAALDGALPYQIFDFTCPFERMITSTMARS